MAIEQLKEKQGGTKSSSQDKGQGALDKDKGRAKEAQIGDDEVRKPVIEEEIVVKKRPVVKEVIRLRKEVVEEEEIVEVDVRREEVEVDNETSRRGK